MRNFPRSSMRAFTKRCCPTGVSSSLYGTERVTIFPCLFASRGSRETMRNFLSSDTVSNLHSERGYTTGITSPP